MENEFEKVIIDREKIYKIFCVLGDVEYCRDAPNVKEAIENTVSDGGIKVIFGKGEQMDNIVNAVITDTMLGYENHGILTFMIFVELACGGSIGIGGYALDGYDETKNKRTPSSKHIDVVAEILNVVGVDNWEKLKGKHIRVVDNGFGNKIDTIGNLMENKWLCFKGYFDNIEEEEDELN